MPSRQARWMGVGSSADPDSAVGGAAAATQARAGDRADAQLVVVFASEQHDLPVLLSAIRGVTGSGALIGCSTAGEIATGGPADASVVVVALGGEGFAVATSVARDVSADLHAAGVQAAAGLQAVSDRPHRLLMLLSDGLAGDQQEIIRGAYAAAGATVPLVGGCAGDDGHMHATHQFYNHEVLTDSVVSAAIGSDGPVGVGVRHGWRRVGESILVTGSAGNRVHELDDRPALDVYLERFDAPPAAYTEHAAFSAFAQTHPLGVGLRGDEDEVRFVADADFAERSLICIAEVPQGALAWLMEGDIQSVLDATDAACQHALEKLGGRTPVGLLAFDCVARKGVLGVDTREEVARVATHAAGAPVAGFYTYGEFARTRGTSGFHNQTLVVLALG